jgi:hypothetical protein
MKLFVKLAVGLCAVAVGTCTEPGGLWIEASEPDDVQTAQSAVDDCQNCRDTDFSWADRETPRSNIFPDSTGTVLNINTSTGVIDWHIEHKPPSPSHLTSFFVRHHNEAFADFHKTFQSAFRPYDGEFEAFGGSFSRRSCHVDASLHGNFVSWYIFQWSKTTLIVPTPILSDHEFHTVKVDLISKRSPFLRFTKAMNSTDMEALGNPVEDFDRSVVTSDPLSRLFKYSNERATRTEWKMSRLQLISLMKGTASGSGYYHRLPKVGDSREASPEPMNSFEQQAVDHLQTKFDEKVVTRLADNEIEMVGALRADNDCMRCHKVEAGTLLGVFSYRLRRADPASFFP